MLSGAHAGSTSRPGFGGMERILGQEHLKKEKLHMRWLHQGKGQLSYLKIKSSIDKGLNMQFLPKEQEEEIS